MEMQQKIAALADSFSDCSCILAAMGDEPRQHLILEMLRMGRCSSSLCPTMRAPHVAA